MSKQKQTHIPVLLESVLGYLNPQKGESYLDLTAGYGGHAQAVLEATQSPAKAVLVDRDPNATAALKKHFVGARIINSDFLAALLELKAQDQSFDMILADLGVSSPQLNEAARGFSFQSSGPLDMRMDQRQEQSAMNLVNSFSQKQMAKILLEYGQEPKAHEIASKIVRRRPLKTTDELSQIAKSAWPAHSRVHPATRTFQALRIAVNDELNQIKSALPLMLDILSPGGRLAIVSFHSLEDRLVKEFFKDNSQGLDAQLKLLTKKTLLATKTEIVSNPRARSAKLRAAAKINTKKERK